PPGRPILPKANQRWKQANESGWKVLKVRLSMCGVSMKELTGAQSSYLLRNEEHKKKDEADTSRVSTTAARYPDRTYRRGSCLLQAGEVRSLSCRPPALPIHRH